MNTVINNNEAIISIHAPREGCDRDDRGRSPLKGISIHAPREGCDTTPLSAPSHPANFNPRTP